MTANIFADLAAPFPPDIVSWRVGATTGDKSKGMALAYIDARDVMERLDRVVGPENWQCEYPHAGVKTVCSIGIKVFGEWVWKADGGGDTDHEAEKGALSDAFKRAAVKWGIGRYLYDLDSPWVAIEQKGKSYVIPQGEKVKLRTLLARDAKLHAQPSPEPNRLGADPVPPGLKDPTPFFQRAGEEDADRKAYVSAAIPTLQGAETKEECDQWWRDELPKRDKYGLKAGVPQYEELLSAFRDHKRKVPWGTSTVMAG
jgi:hypothetical protein